MPTITVLYFAQLREQRGLDQESLLTSATTADALWTDVVQRFGLHFERSSLQVAVDDAFAPWDAPLADGATVVFLPPVSGG